MARSRGIRRWRVGLTGLVLAALLVGGSAPGGQGQKQEVDLPALIRETQKLSPRANEVSLVWWIPAEYWQVVLGQDPKVNKAQIEEIVKTLRPYTVLVVVDWRSIGGGDRTIRMMTEVTDY